MIQWAFSALSGEFEWVCTCEISTERFSEEPIFILTEQINIVCPFYHRMSSRALRRLTRDTEFVSAEQPDLDESTELASPSSSSFSAFPRRWFEPCRSIRRRAFSCSENQKKAEIQNENIKKDELFGEFNVERCATRSSKRAPVKTTQTTDLLVVTGKTLDPVMELARIFGPSAIRDAGMNPHQQHPQAQCRTKRGPLVRIKLSWPPITRFGLDMERLPDGSYTFTHNKDYRNIQKAFYSALDSMDLNNFMHILTDCPYHIDSLLQLSEILMHQDNSEMGSDLLERVLHAYQSGFHPCFNPLIGTCRLDYKRQENRGLFVALFRYVLYIGMRGCYRSALDYCKILFSLDVEDDPLAVLLMIDHYALLSRQYEWLISLYEWLNPSRNLCLLPNFALSIALSAKFLRDSKIQPSGIRDADLLIQDALILFPGFVTRLLKHTSIGNVANLDRSILFGREVQREPESLGRLLDLYVARTHHLWTSPDVHTWLESNVETVLILVEPEKCPELSTQPHRPTDSRLMEYTKRRQTCYPSLPLNVLRHLLLAELPEAPPIIPPHLQATQIYGFDPLPPKDSVDIYSPEEESCHTTKKKREGSSTTRLPKRRQEQSRSGVGFEPSAFGRVTMFSAERLRIRHVWIVVSMDLRAGSVKPTEVERGVHRDSILDFGCLFPLTT
ncbi:transcription factor 25 [Clonorchis sinensis]|uniref:Transcription factor 25 n=1 Tax=Clonorchis sinensis TaxID=79923 RepID=G7Y2U7_CLOSI|nr:transcription factor 25 [Clonorchis sinensis]